MLKVLSKQAKDIVALWPDSNALYAKKIILTSVILKAVLIGWIL